MAFSPTPARAKLQDIELAGMSQRACQSFYNQPAVDQPVRLPVGVKNPNLSPPLHPACQLSPAAEMPAVLAWAALCQQRTDASHQNASLFDRLVDAHEERHW